MATPTPADRAKAGRIRLKLEAGRDCDAGEIAWLTAYEQTPVGELPPPREDFGASQAKTSKVTFTEEKTEAQAVGLGQAAALATASAMATREEGRRLDSIIDRGLNALTRAVETYEKMVQQMLKERQADAQLHRGLLESVRTHFIARSEAEADVIRTNAEADAREIAASGGAEGNGFEGMIAQLIQGGFSVKPTNGDSGKKGEAAD